MMACPCGCGKRLAVHIDADGTRVTDGECPKTKDRWVYPAGGNGWLKLHEYKELVKRREFNGS